MLENLGKEGIFIEENIAEYAFLATKFRRSRKLFYAFLKEMQAKQSSEFPEYLFIEAERNFTPEHWRSKDIRELVLKTLLNIEVPEKG